MPHGEKIRNTFYPRYGEESRLDRVPKIAEANSVISISVSAA